MCNVVVFVLENLSVMSQLCVSNMFLFERCCVDADGVSLMFL